MFGYVCYAQVAKVKRTKFEDISEKSMFMGYSSMSKDYRLYNLKSGKVIINRDVIFDENASWNREEKKVKQKFVPVTIMQQKLVEKVENDAESPQSAPRIDPSLSSSS